MLVIVGLYPRIVAAAAGLLLLAFALTMTLALAVKAPLDLSGFSACAGVFLLAAISRSGCAECWSRQKKKYGL